MKELKIAGFTTNTRPDTQPAICVHGIENTGTTRFGCTAPEPIGWIAIDKNSKLTVEEYKATYGLQVMVNSRPYIAPRDAIKIALLDKPEESKAIYKDAVSRIFDDCMALASNPDINSIVLDRASQVFDYILFSHFGRKNQIETFQRGAPNQDMIDLITAMGDKNLVLICKSADIWEDSGEVDKNGKKKQAPTGKKKAEGFSKIGQFVTATIELTSSRGKAVGNTEAEKLASKYRVKVAHCKGNVLLEGLDLNQLGCSGENITWDNVLTLIKSESAGGGDEGDGDGDEERL